MVKCAFVYMPPFQWFKRWNGGLSGWPLRKCKCMKSVVGWKCLLIFASE